MPHGWAVTEFAGEIPSTDDRLLADKNASAAWNLNLNGGRLEGLPALKPLIILPFVDNAPAQRAYRLPPPDPTQDDVWLPLPSPFSSVVRSPLANDTLHRIYWTNPGEGAFWTTYSRLQNLLPPYNLGTVQPSDVSAAPPGVTSSGGTLDGSIPLIERSYTWTFVDAYSQESAPVTPSAVVSGASDGTWVITGIPTSAPLPPAGRNYPQVIGVKLYRTVSGASGAQFYLVASWVYTTSAPPDSYTDTLSDADAVSKDITLISAAWNNPPLDLDGLIALGGGMLVGFTGNTLHFCEPNRPHTWPAAYDISAHYDIVGLAVWQNSLVVLTQGYPSTGTGTSPSVFQLQEVQVAEPCIARGSIISDLLGVYYASPNGIVMLNYYGMTNQTNKMIQRNQWLTEFNAAGIIGCRYRSQYLALTGVGLGFSIDFGEGTGVVQLNTFDNAVCIWTDPYSGTAYVMADGTVYEWGSPDTQQILYRWRSKRWVLPIPISVGAVQVISDPSIVTPLPDATVLGTEDPELTLPEGVNAMFRLYTSESLIIEMPLAEETEQFRVPGGFKAFDWQFEIVSRVPVVRVELAPTMKDLRGV